MEKVAEGVSKIVREQLGRDSVDYNHRFVEDLGADSLDSVKLVMRLEDEYKMKIPDEDAENY